MGTEAKFTLELLDKARAAMESGRIQPVNGCYRMTVSPRVAAYLTMLRAKAHWKAQYRAQRIARRWIARAYPTNSE